MRFQQNRPVTDRFTQAVAFSIYAASKEFLIQNKVPVEGDDCRIFLFKPLDESDQPIRFLGLFIQLVKPPPNLGEKILTRLFELCPFEIAFGGPAGVEKVKIYLDFSQELLDIRKYCAAAFNELGMMKR